jgi:hypothetical protein
VAAAAMTTTVMAMHVRMMAPPHVPGSGYGSAYTNYGEERDSK